MWSSPYGFSVSVFSLGHGTAYALLSSRCSLLAVIPDDAVVAAAQMVGGIAAAAIVHGLTPGPLRVGVGLNLNTNKAQGVFIEMFATCALTLSVLMLAAGASRHSPAKRGTEMQRRADSRPWRRSCSAPYLRWSCCSLYRTPVEPSSGYPLLGVATPVDAKHRTSLWARVYRGLQHRALDLLQVARISLPFAADQQGSALLLAPCSRPPSTGSSRSSTTGHVDPLARDAGG